MEQQPTYPPAILQAIHKVMASVQHVPKDKRNQHFNYDYASEAAVVKAFRGPMLDAGLVLLPSVTDVIPGDKGLVTVRVEITLAHVDGSVWPHKIGWAGNGQDNQDKAVAKALTSAMKYFMLRFFLVDSGEDPDGDGPNNGGTPQPRQQGPQNGHRPQNAQRGSQGPRNPDGPASDAQKRAIFGNAKGLGWTSDQVKAWIKEWWPDLQSFDDITAGQAHQAIDALIKRKGGQ